MLSASTSLASVQLAGCLAHPMIAYSVYIVHHTLPGNMFLLLFTTVAAAAEIINHKHLWLNSIQPQTDRGDFPACGSWLTVLEQA